MKTTIQLSFVICLLTLGGALQAQDYNYLNYLYGSSPSLQASRQLAGQVDGWFREMDQAVQEYQRKYPNGNPQAEARGRQFLMGMQGAYQIQENASYQRRKTQLQRRYRDTYNNAKAWRDYYQSKGYDESARKMEAIMEAYDPDQFD